MKNILFCFFLFTFYGFSQEIKPQFISKQKINLDQFFGFDALGDFYYTKNNVFFKQSKIKLFEYLKVSLGKISSIDIHNPLKIVLFYDDFNTVVTLDNQLNETQSINFSDFESPINVLATGLASNNSLWIFNTFDNKIGLFNYLNRSFKPISNPISTKIKYFESDFNYLFFIDDQNNLRSCDIYGRILNLCKIPDYDKINLNNNTEIIYSLRNQLFLLDIYSNQTKIINITEKTFENFSYKNQILTIFTNQEITNYKINIE